MPDTNDKSGSNSTSEQPKAAASTHGENKGTNKPKKVKGAKPRDMSGSNGTSEQP